MNIIWGIILTIFSSVSYFGQLISVIWPELAEKWGLTELETAVDSTFFADVRGEALWDVAILWPLPTAGILLLLNNPLWVYFGFVGGGMYFYFAGRGIVTRRVMQRRGVRIGSPETLKINYIFLSLTGLVAFITIIFATGLLPIL